MKPCNRAPNEYYVLFRAMLVYALCPDLSVAGFRNRSTIFVLSGTSFGVARLPDFVVIVIGVAFDCSVIRVLLMSGRLSLAYRS